jgi:gas vesicle protein
LAGGVGVGAGLLYLLDPDKGKKRRGKIWSSAADLASSAGDYAGSALSGIGGKIGGALGSAKEYAGDKLSGISGYASDRVDDAKAFAQKQVFGETRAEHRVGVTLCALSSMALGAALMYAFDPSSGKNRRRMIRDKASDLASSAGDYARQAGDAIKTGVGQVRDKISGASHSTDSMSNPVSGNAGGTMSGIACATEPNSSVHI